MKILILLLAVLLNQCQAIQDSVKKWNAASPEIMELKLTTTSVNPTPENSLYNTFTNQPTEFQIFIIFVVIATPVLVAVTVYLARNNCDNCENPYAGGHVSRPRFVAPFY